MLNAPLTVLLEGVFWKAALTTLLGGVFWSWVHWMDRKAKAKKAAEIEEANKPTEPAIWFGPNPASPTHVLTYDKKWWPRVKKIGEETFEVKTNDVNRVIASPVSLSYWSDRARGGYVGKGLYQIVFDGGRVVNGGHESQAGVFDLFRETKKYANARIDHVRWSKGVTPIETDSGVWGLTLEVWTLVGAYPWQRAKGDSLYLNPRTRNLILERLTDNDEIAAAFEANMAEVYAKTSNGYRQND